VLEWELFVHPAGATYMRKSMLSKMPPVVGPLVFSMLRSHLRKQLYARGLARHTPDIIEAKGRADIDALAAFLGDKPFLLGPQPSTADTAVFGLVAPMVFWPMQTPVASYAKSVGTVSRYCDRMRERCLSKQGRFSDYQGMKIEQQGKCPERTHGTGTFVMASSRLYTEFENDIRR
jgi:glutathione S-transferase